LVALSFLGVLGFYGLRKPTGDQTSYYQPIKLKNTGNKWPTDITGLELAFTNSQYAEKFPALTNQRSSQRNSRFLVLNVGFGLIAAGRLT
jgi:hypothetical protein